MQKNKNLAILIILVIAAIFIWMPKGRRKALLSLKPARVSLKKTMAPIGPAGRKRSEFADWGRNPFLWSKDAAGSLSGLRLSGIVWDEEASYAIISGSIVHAGDKIAGKTIKRIERNKVILTEGAEEYILELE